MRRWTKNILCLFSLLIFAASVTLWVRSYQVGYAVDHDSVSNIANPHAIMTRTVRYGLWAACGCVAIYRQEYELAEPPDRAAGWYYTRERTPTPLNFVDSTSNKVDLRFVGTHFAVFDQSGIVGKTIQYWFVLPLWLFLPLAIPPILWLRRRRKSGRAGGRGFEVEAGGRKTSTDYTNFTD